VATAVPRSRPSVVLETKLDVPAPPAGLVQRHELVALLTARADRRLTLLSAPPGSGKTTLLGEWHAAAGESLPFAWLSLDAEDNDPVRFWGLVIAALRRVLPAVGARAEAVLAAPGTTPTGDVVPRLVNELVDAPRRVALVLDDYHLVHEPEIHRSLRYLLERPPRTLHIVVATRADPPFALPRMRVRDELTELRGVDLRFTDAQTDALLNDALGLGLDRLDVARLHERTEGWPAALQLAALSLRMHPDPRAFIASFAGDDRHIVDYLGSEVLDRVSDDTRAFLVRTSILDRLGPELCDAVIGGGDAAGALEALERANVFVTALDSNRQWYRYHGLFAELLRRRLELDEPALVPELHRRAGVWYAEHGFASDAVRHALAAGDHERAAGLAAAHWSELFNSGRLATVAGWLDALPAAAVERDTELWLARAWIALDTGRLDEVGRLLEPTADVDGPRERWRALLAALHRFKSGDLPTRDEGARWLGAAEDATAPAFWRTVAYCVGGVILFWRGDLDRAEEAVAAGLRVAETDGNVVATSYLLGYSAALALERGQPAAAQKPLERLGDLTRSRPELDEHFTASVGHVARGVVRGERAELTRGIELARRGAGTLELAYALLADARARGDRPQLERVRDLAAASADAGVLARMVGAPRPLATRHRAARGVDDELSERELEVLRLLATSLSQRDVGRELYVSLNTVKSHVKSIFRKLDVSTRAEAVERARELGLL
jgi:LuxR family transcriptional regulator, maltose regulon positive regulatory protein